MARSFCSLSNVNHVLRNVRIVLVSQYFTAIVHITVGAAGDFNVNNCVNFD